MSLSEGSLTATAAKTTTAITIAERMVVGVVGVVGVRMVLMNVVGGKTAQTIGFRSKEMMMMMMLLLIEIYCILCSTSLQSRDGKRITTITIDITITTTNTSTSGYVFSSGSSACCSCSCSL